MKNQRIIAALLALIFYSGISVAQTTTNAQSYYDEGIKLKEGNKAAEALEKFKKAISLNPKHTDALYQAGWCQNDLKNYSSALSYFARQGKQA